MRRLKGMLVVVMMIAMSAMTVSASADLSVKGGNNNYNYGTGSTITKAEWIHNIVLMFDMTVEEDNMPDEYFSDVTNEHAYYRDIMVATEFGVIDLEAGSAFSPDEDATREFVAHTMNFCLGYELAEDATYSYSDVEQVAYPIDNQIAIDRSWFALENGKFSPEKKVAESEIRAIIDDAKDVWKSTEIQENHNNVYDFKDEAVEVPQGTQVQIDEEKVLIYDCPVAITEGDIFVVYINDIPNAYKAQVISEEGNLLSISAEEAVVDEVAENIDAQGITEGDLALVEALGDAQVTYIVGGSEARAFEDGRAYATPRAAGIQKINAVKISSNIRIGNKNQFNIQCTLTGMKVEYNINTGRKEAYVAVSGAANINGSASVNLGALGVPSKINLAYVPIGGIGGITVSADYSLSGRVALTYSTGFTAGLQYSPQSGFRIVKSFTKQRFTISSELNFSTGITVAAAIDKLPIISGRVYAKMGAKTRLTSDTYDDGNKPNTCLHISSHLYASMGASLTIDWVFDRKTFGKDITIYSESNSPVRVVYHYEDNKQVACCTRRPYGYYTSGFSRYGSTSSGYGIDGEGNFVPVYTYILDGDGNATITGYTGRASALIIPETVDDYPVVAIGYGAFSGRTDLSTVLIPDSVTVIEASAFSDCTMLENVVLSKNLVQIGAEAFGSCTNLTEIEIPKKLEEGLASWDFGIQKGPFYNCASLERVTFEEGIKQIADALFAGCNGIKELVIPDTVTVIEYGAFGQCKNLQNITISDSVTSIEGSAFEKCERIVNLKIPDSVTKIEARAFSDCTMLKSVVLSKNLVQIGGEAFGSCINLTEIEIPKKLEEGSSGYGGGLERGPFYNCVSLERVTFEEGIKQIADALFAGCNGIKELVIPDTVKVIEFGAFYKCENLQNITIPDNVTSIEAWVFSECSDLTKISLPKDLPEITQRLFSGTTSLESLTLPENITRIGAEAFEGSAIKTIEVPNKVDLINYGAFKNSGVKTVKILDAKANIDNSAFYQCVELESVTLGNGVTSIGTYAFSKCNKLAKIVIPDSVTSIGNYIFADNDLLSDVSIGTGVTVIPNYAFNQCAKLESISLPYRVTTINTNAFTNCVKLKSLTIPSSTTTIASTIVSYAGNVTIYGLAGSYAETYASSKGITFVAKEVASTQVAINKSETILNRDTTEELILSVTPTDFTDAVDWKSTDINIVAVDQAGVITAKNVGTATIKVTVGNNSATCAVTVVQPVTSISLNRTTLSLGATETFKLTASVSPAAANNKTINWTSADSSIATVDETGMVTALKKGTTTITAAATDGSGITRNCSVTVTSNVYIVTDVNEMESKHNYESNCADYWVYTLVGASSINVTFDERTRVEEGFDYIFVFDKGGNQIGKYTGQQLAGVTLTIQGDTIKVRLVSDNGGNEWGFKVSSVTQATAKGTQVIEGTSVYNKMVGDADFKVDSVLKSGNGTLQYTSKNLSVATVDGTGKVKVVGVGDATIQVEATETPEYKSARFNITLKVKAKGEVVTTPPTLTPTKAPAQTPTKVPAQTPTKTPAQEETAKCIITFNGNGGKATENKRLIEKNGVYGALPSATRAKYIFKGWYTAKSGGKKIAETDKATANQTVYAQWTKITVKKAEISKLTNAKGKKIKVTWKKVKSAEGYQVVYATDKKFKKSKKTTDTTKKSLTSKKLKKGKTYYVKVRAYITDSAGKKVYGKYSATQKVKIKK